jgi:hypothetical protein
MQGGGVGGLISRKCAASYFNALVCWLGHHSPNQPTASLLSTTSSSLARSLPLRCCFTWSPTLFVCLSVSEWVPPCRKLLLRWFGRSQCLLALFVMCVRSVMWLAELARSAPLVAHSTDHTTRQWWLVLSASLDLHRAAVSLQRLFACTHQTLHGTRRHRRACRPTRTSARAICTSVCRLLDV